MHQRLAKNALPTGKGKFSVNKAFLFINQDRKPTFNLLIASNEFASLVPAQHRLLI
jgi:hypothetical protein